MCVRPLFLVYTEVSFCGVLCRLVSQQTPPTSTLHLCKVRPGEFKHTNKRHRHVVECVSNCSTWWSADTDHLQHQPHHPPTKPTTRRHSHQPTHPINTAVLLTINLQNTYTRPYTCTITLQATQSLITYTTCHTHSGFNSM